MNGEKKEGETVRRLTGEDIPLLSPCLERLASYHNALPTEFRGIYPVVPVALHLRDMRDHLANDTAVILGMFDGAGVLVGFGMASEEGGYGEIDYLYIDEALRGGGRGGRLMEMLLAILEERGATFVDVNVLRGNPAAKFYARYGFAPRSEILSKRIYH